MRSPHILFLFIDGVGLGGDDPTVNPLAAAHLPTLHGLTNGQRWLADVGRQRTPRSAFVPTDPRLGVPGRPQSGSSQAAILTGLNVPSLIGEHYGPKPNAPIRDILQQDNLFMTINRAGKRAALLDAYPPSLLNSIARGKTLPSSIQMAAILGGQSLFDADALRAGQAVTAEWTGQEWRSHLKFADTPLYTPQEAGRLLVALSRQYDFAMHSHWMTDYIGHRGTLEEGVHFMERLDGVIEGVLSSWEDDEGLVILTSDHGNMEMLGDRRHTENDVPTLIIGARAAEFAEGLADLTQLAPRVKAFLGL
jgi:predicted AlkP superfamily pyrophosphatase or phosphodiesterase